MNLDLADKLVDFFLSIDRTEAMQLLYLFGLVFLARFYVWLERTKIFQLRMLSVSLVNCLSLLIIFLFFSVLFSILLLGFEPKILYVALFVVFNMTVLFVGLKISRNRFLRLFYFCLVTSVLILGASENMSFKSLYSDIDRIGRCGFVSGIEDCYLPDQKTKDGANSELGLSRPKTNDVSSHSSFTVFVISIYYFFCFFAYFRYYGEVLRIRHQHRVGATESGGLDNSTIEKVVIVVAFASSCVLGVVFAGGDIPSITVFSGLLVAGVSVALKDLLHNLMAGVILIWDQSIRRGNVISTPSGIRGEVVNLTMRYIAVKDRDDVVTLIPNSYFTSNPIENLSQNGDDVRLSVRFFLPNEIWSEVDDNDDRKHPSFEEIADQVKRAVHREPRVNSDGQTRVFITDFTPQGVVISVLFWIRDPQKGLGNIRATVRSAIITQLSRMGINIPYPVYHVVARNDGLHTDLGISDRELKI